MDNAAPRPPHSLQIPKKGTQRKLCSRQAAFCALLYVAVLAAVGLSLGLSVTRTRESGNATYVPPAPDYHLTASWAALPTKTDPADIVPTGCGRGRQRNEERADCFFVHPTSFMSSTLYNADTRDIPTNVLTDVGQLMTQASAFNGVAAIYAPRYRQVSQFAQGTHDTWNNNGGSDLETPLQAAM